MVHRADVSTATEAEDLVNFGLATYGPQIDILVNLAGGMVARRPLAELDADFVDQVMGLNFRSAVLMTRAGPHMIAEGSILNFSSQAGRAGGGPGAAIYAASNGAVSTFTAPWPRNSVRMASASMPSALA